MLGFAYRRHMCFSLSCAYAADAFGACCHNTSHAAHAYWVACCPCRSAMGCGCFLLGGLADAINVCTHCYEAPGCADCCDRWCGCHNEPLRLGAELQTGLV